MKQTILNLGKVLTKIKQQQIKGGGVFEQICIRCGGRPDPYAPFSCDGNLRVQICINGGIYIND